MDYYAAHTRFTLTIRWLMGVTTSLPRSNFNASPESRFFSASGSSTSHVREVLDRIHLLTADAYARNLNSAMLGDRVAILLSIEDWQRASTGFCYRVIGADGTPICGAGFQSLICTDTRTGRPLPWPSPLWDTIEEVESCRGAPATVVFSREGAGRRKQGSILVRRRGAEHGHPISCGALPQPQGDTGRSTGGGCRPWLHGGLGRWRGTGQSARRSRHGCSPGKGHSIRNC